MKKRILLLICVLVSLVASSQTSNKFILNFNAHRNDFARPTDNHFKRSFWFPSIEYLRKKEKRILSFELAKYTRKTLGTIAIDQNNTPNIVYKNRNTQSMIRMQYQRLTKVLISDSTLSVHPYYGIALTPHFSYTKGTALISTLTNKDIRSFGASAHASLGLYCQFRRFFLNVNTLLGFAQVEVIKEMIHDASLSHEQQNINYTKIKLLPKDNLFRIGIGFGI